MDAALKARIIHPQSKLDSRTGLLITTLPFSALESAFCASSSLLRPVLGNNPALQAFRSNRMLYQLLSLVAVRSDIAGGLYEPQCPRFAWVFDPDRCHVVAGACENMGSGDAADRSAGRADAYLTSIIMAANSRGPHGAQMVDESRDGHSSLEEQLEAQRALLEQLRLGLKADTKTADNINAQSPDAFLDEYGLIPDLLDASSLPFDVFVAPPRDCPWPYGDCPPPKSWWLSRHGSRTVFTHAQSEFEAAHEALRSSEASCVNRSSIVPVTSSTELLHRVYEQQPQWLRIVARWRESGELPSTWTQEQRCV